MIYDVIIIGGGAAGITAAIYAKRALLSTVLIEENFLGGQIITATEIDNYSGFTSIDGVSLAKQFQIHAEKMETQVINSKVIKIENGDIKKVILQNGDTLESKTIIYATGASHKSLGIEGESRLIGSGVSYCAVCDGAFFRKKCVAVIGGGDTAVKEALYLSRICEKVYLVHRRDTLRAAKYLQEKIKITKNIECLFNYIPVKITGEFSVEQLQLQQVQSKEYHYLDVKGIFIAVGMEPKTELLKEICKLDSSGYVVAGEDCKTSAEGIFVAGDVRTKEVRQIITAASDGANAAIQAEMYLSESKV